MGISDAIFEYTPVKVWVDLIMDIINVYAWQVQKVYSSIKVNKYTVM